MRRVPDRHRGLALPRVPPARTAAVAGEGAERAVAGEVAAMTIAAARALVAATDNERSAPQFSEELREELRRILDPKPFPMPGHRIRVHCRSCGAEDWETCPPSPPMCSQLTWFCGPCRHDWNLPSPAFALPTGRYLSVPEYQARYRRTQEKRRLLAEAPGMLAGAGG